MSIRSRLGLSPLERPRLPERLTRDGWWLVEAGGPAAIAVPPRVILGARRFAETSSTSADPAQYPLQEPSS